MTANYYPPDDDWYTGQWAAEEVVYHESAGSRPLPVELILLTGVVLVVVAMITGLSRLGINTTAASQPVAQVPQAAVQENATTVSRPLTLTGADAFILPYDEYIITQGPHGMSYGHYAIDIASGQGEPVLSPINGRVSQFFFDGIGNPTLVIVNERYEVTMLHGDYTVTVGQEVRIGEQVGTESNKGNTRDMTGRSCRNRDCGYHTHLNVFDKQAGINVNPLDLMSTN